MEATLGPQASRCPGTGRPASFPEYGQHQTTQDAHHEGPLPEVKMSVSYVRVCLARLPGAGVLHRVHTVPSGLASSRQGWFPPSHCLTEGLLKGVYIFTPQHGAQAQAFCPVSPRLAAARVPSMATGSAFIFKTYIYLNLYI